MPTLLIPPILRPFTEHRERVEVAAATVEQAVDELAARYPEAGARLRQAIARRYVIVTVDGSDIRDRAGAKTPLAAGQELHLLWAVAGG